MAISKLKSPIFELESEGVNMKLKYPRSDLREDETLESAISALE